MPRPLTILQVGAFPFPLHQGSQVYVRGMATALARRGHRVLLACWAHGDGPDPEGVQMVRAVPVPGGRVERSGPHWSRGVQDLALIAAVRRALRQGVDVVHAHNVEAPVVARIARGRHRVPVIYDQHTRMEQELPTYVRGRLRRRVARGVGGVVDRWVPALCDASIALSEAGALALRATGAREVVRLDPAVDLDDLRGADPDRARARWRLGDRPWVVYAGNTDAYQELPLWFEAMARLPKAGLLLLTGDDHDPWERRDAALGIGEDRCRLVRTRDFAEVRDGLAAAALAVSPRSQCAGFPIKLLNSLGLGVPTVAAGGSARDLPGVVAVPPRDPEALAGALGALLADPGRRAHLGEIAREAVRTRWSWAPRAARLEEFYRRIRAAG